MNSSVARPLVRTLAWGLIASAAAALVACVGGVAGGAGPASLPTPGGQALAPTDVPAAVSALGLSESAETAADLAGAGRAGRQQGLLTPALQAGQPVYNPVDGRFYGITHQPGRRGSLWRLDPDSNSVDLLVRFNGKGLAEAAAASAQPRRSAQATADARTVAGTQGVWLSNPLVSADGRSLYLVADLGGRFLRGVVMHVDIDPASASAGQAGTVFTFADRDLPDEDGCVEPAARTGYQLAWGADEPAGPVLLLSRGRVQAARAPLPTSPTGAADPATPDTAACSLALLPARGGAAGQAWDLAEAVRQASPWPARLPGEGAQRQLVAAGAWPDIARAGLPGAGALADGAARYQLSVAPAWGGRPLALLKRDLATGDTTRLPLDLAAASLQPGPWLPLGGGRALARVARAPLGAPGARRGSVGGLIETETPAQGLALVDASSGRITRLASHRTPLQSAQSLVQLADGSLWDVRLEPGRQGVAARTVYRIDRQTLAATASVSLPDAVPLSARAADGSARPAGTAGFGTGPAEAYAVAGRGQALYLGTHTVSAGRQSAAARPAAAQPQLRLSCVRTDLPGQVASHAGLGLVSPVSPAPSARAAPQPSTRLVAGPTHAPAQGAIYMATVQAGRGGAPDTAALHEVDRGLADDALCRRAPQVLTLVDGLTDLPVTRVLATRDGALLYAARSGKLMRLEPEQRRVTTVADLRAPGAGQRQWVADLAEVGPGRLDALVQALDARGRSLGRHRVQVAFGAATGRVQAVAVGTTGVQVIQAH